MKVISKSIQLGGRTLTLETGRYAYQADAAVLGRYGDTMVLVTVVSAEPREGINYFPLDVEYVERLYAGGRIKGSRWVKREGRPSDEAILTGRLVDRSIRPLFPKGYFKEVQVTVTVLSVDSENDPAILAAVATSAALSISSIPWNGPTGTVRVGLKEGAYFVNPINGEMQFSDLDLVVSTVQDKVVMIEAQAKEVPEKQILGAIEFAQKESKKIVDLIGLLVKEGGKKKQDFEPKKVDPELKKEVAKLTGGQIKKMIEEASLKIFGAEEYEELRMAISQTLSEEKRGEIGQVLEELFQEELRKMIQANKRPDGRKMDEIRPLKMELGILPRTHGSAMFARGETQVLTVTTLGSPSLEQLIESPEGEETKRFLHHYNMPPFSTGEAGRFGWPSRREVGHGALVEKALESVIPLEDKFPYTIRLVSEILSSNGSTSMAAVCGSTLSLMDAGVPISTPVAGIALGLILDKKPVIFSDIIGLEDFCGDMDLKIAGTSKGVTAIQMDVKNKGLTGEILEKAFTQGNQGRAFILKKMEEVISEPRTKISQYAPKISILHLPVEKIGDVIGPGGRTIRKIISDTQTSIDIEDDGTVNISGIDEEKVAEATKLIKGLTHEVKPGEIYEGEVKRIQPFGAFVEILPGKEGLVHISQMASGFVSSPEKIVSIGDKVKVRVIEIDDLGRINLSMLFGKEMVKKEREKKRGFVRRKTLPSKSFRPPKPRW